MVHWAPIAQLAQSHPKEAEAQKPDGKAARAFACGQMWPDIPAVHSEHRALLGRFQAAYIHRGSAPELGALCNALVAWEP